MLKLEGELFAALSGSTGSAGLSLWYVWFVLKLCDLAPYVYGLLINCVLWTISARRLLMYIGVYLCEDYSQLPVLFYCPCPLSSTCRPWVSWLSTTSLSAQVPLSALLQHTSKLDDVILQLSIATEMGGIYSTALDRTHSLGVLLWSLYVSIQLWFMLSDIGAYVPNPDFQESSNLEVQTLGSRVWQL